MFTAMIESLKIGELPSSKDLAARLKPALVKKNGVIQQPRPCWSSDPKINPDATHLLWAAMLVEDRELISIATGMLFIEQGHKLELLTAEKARVVILEKGDELLDLAPSPDFMRVLADKLHKAISLTG